MPVTALSKIERSRFNEIEKSIERTKMAFIECGQLLMEVRDQKLYREEYPSFDDYCSVRWKFTRQRASQLIQAVVMVKQLPERVSTRVDSEKSARELAQVPKDKRVAVMDSIPEKMEISPKTIKAAAEEKEKEPLDKTSHPIPALIRDDWFRAEEVGRDLMQAISEVKVRIEKGIADEDVIFNEIKKSQPVTELKSIYGIVSNIVPYSVCTSCQGHSRSKCSFCRGRGFISKFLFDHAVPEETKKLRKAQ